MLFNSLQFVLFFPIVVFLYFTIPSRFRWIFLLAASYYFYMCWKLEYVLLIISSTLVDYFAGIQMGKTKLKARRKKYLVLSLCTNLGLLFFFKYFNFFSNSLNAVFSHYNIFYHAPSFKILLPVGISFYTFQTLSYTIDVYRGVREPEKHLGIFALYVAFFPQLVAGPIERSTRLLPQFFKKNDFDPQRLLDGLKLILWGFFKKMVVADRLAVFVDRVYNNPGDYHGTSLILATYFFAFQIYCDFSGYSDIAIGSAHVMGYSLMDNFKRPYLSKSVSEFWKRWHISLSSWFKDYLYISLGGNRVAKTRWYSNILIVFVLSGLWHGANWTFLVWGILHGFYLLVSIWTRKLRHTVSNFLNLTKFPSVHNLLRVCITFHLVLFAWIFFRANSLSDAMTIIKNIFIGLDLHSAAVYVLSKKSELVLALLSILFVEIIHIVHRHKDMRHFFSDRPLWLRWAFYYSVIFGILIFGDFTNEEFIYFQF